MESKGSDLDNLLEESKGSGRVVNDDKSDFDISYDGVETKGSDSVDRSSVNQYDRMTLRSRSKRIKQVGIHLSENKQRQQINLECLLWKGLLIQ